MINRKVLEDFNLLGMFVIVLISAAAYFFQFYYHELPCPLCLLQRLGLLFAGFGLVLNFRYGFKTSHYAMSLFGGLFTAAVAARQILLHIADDSVGYGTPFLGVHLYSWVFLFAVGWLVYIGIMLLLSTQFVNYPKRETNTLGLSATILSYCMLILVIMNVVTTFLICGFEFCPENPVTYFFRSPVV